MLSNTFIRTERRFSEHEANSKAIISFLLIYVIIQTNQTTEPLKQSTLKR
jgi:hypothetical protein